MRDYGKVGPRFWTSGSGRRLRGDTDAQLLALYLMTCPASTMTGLYNIALPTMAHEAGMSIERVRKALQRLEAEDVAHFDEEADVVWVVNMATFQIGETLNPRDKRVLGIIRELMPFRRHRFAKDFLSKYGASFQVSMERLGRPSEGASEDSIESGKALPSQEQEQEQEIGVKDSVLPSLPTSPSGSGARDPWRSGHEWLQAFGRRWAKTRNQQGDTGNRRPGSAVSYGTGSDIGATRNLEDGVLDRVPEAEGTELWERCNDLFDAYLDDDDPYLVKAGHPFALFVARFAQYRPGARASPGRQRNVIKAPPNFPKAKTL